MKLIDNIKILYIFLFKIILNTYNLISSLYYVFKFFFLNSFLFRKNFNFNKSYNKFSYRLYSSVSITFFPIDNYKAAQFSIVNKFMYEIFDPIILYMEYEFFGINVLSCNPFFKHIIFLKFSNNGLYHYQFKAFTSAYYLNNLSDLSIMLSSNLISLSKFTCYIFNKSYSYLLLRSFIFRFKNHNHHIIPTYFSQYQNLSHLFNLNFFKNFLFNFDKFLLSIPFYLLLVISLSSLFTLFFIFLHKGLDITSLTTLNTFIYYFSLFFYIFTLTYSLFNFFLYVQEEYKCSYIYTKKVEQQYLFGIILFIISEAMLFFSFF